MLVAGSAIGCQEPVYGPPRPLELTLHPAMIWGVGEVALTSGAFRGVELVPLQGPEGPVVRRWSNFAVLIDGDTVDSWRIDDTTMAASTPTLHTGVYALTAVVPGVTFRSAQLEVVGLRHSYDVFFDAPNGRRTVFWRWVPARGMPPRGLVSFQRYAADLASMVWLDLPTRDARAIAGVELAGMLGPGPSYLPGHVVADLVGDDLGTVSLQVNGSNLPQASHAVPCQPSDGPWYAVAEIGPGPTCLGWWNSTFWTNGAVPIAQRSIRGGLSFRMSTDGRHTIPIVESCDVVADQGDRWLVFDATPAVAYELEGVGCVRGAAFTPDGDTLYLVGEEAVSGGATRVHTTQVRDASSGRLLRSLVVEGARNLLDVLADPVQPWLYVALKEQSGLSLLVLDRETLERVALIRAWWWPYEGTLVWGGTWGVYFYGTYDCVGDCGRVWEFDVPARYPPE